MTERLNLEANFREAVNRNIQQSKGEKFVKYMGDKILLPAATNVAKGRVQKYMNKLLDDIEKTAKNQQKRRNS